MPADSLEPSSGRAARLINHPGPARGRARELLIAEKDAQRERWRQHSMPGWPADVNKELPMLDPEIELRAGRPVVVGSGQLFTTLHHAGLDWRPYAFGGRHFRSVFVLDENDRLTELMDE